MSRQESLGEGDDESRLKPVNGTQWVTTPAR